MLLDLRYGGNAWSKLFEPDEVCPHVHACPECYEHVPCTMNCTLEPDLELDDGTPCGSHCVCERCRHAGEVDRASSSGVVEL